MVRRQDQLFSSSHFVSLHDSGVLPESQTAEHSKQIAAIAN